MAPNLKREPTRPPASDVAHTSIFQSHVYVASMVFCCGHPDGRYQHPTSAHDEAMDASAPERRGAHHVSAEQPFHSHPLPPLKNHQRTAESSRDVFEDARQSFAVQAAPCPPAAYIVFTTGQPHRRLPNLPVTRWTDPTVHAAATQKNLHNPTTHTYIHIPLEHTYIHVFPSGVLGVFLFFTCLVVSFFQPRIREASEQQVNSKRTASEQQANSKRTASEQQAHSPIVRDAPPARAPAPFPCLS